MSRFDSPKPIQEILEQTLKSLQIEQPAKKYSVLSFWEEIVGAKIAQKAEPTRFSGDTLVVSVVSHPWMTELALMKPFILQKINEKIKDSPFKNIRFELAPPSRNKGIEQKPR